jgi:hypothetical protein
LYSSWRRDRLGDVFLTYPFLMVMIAGGLAGASAVLLRRAAEVFGAWLEIPSFLAAAAAVAAFIWALAWAWTLTTKPPTPSLGRAVPGLALALLGGVLAGWTLRVRGWRPRRTWRRERDEAAQPYATIRRAMPLGGFTVSLGVALLSGLPAVWIWLAGLLLIWSVILELGDWEQRQRLPACRDYMERTPRYLPIRRWLGAGRRR